MKIENQNSNIASGILPTKNEPITPEGQFSQMLEEIKKFKEDLYELGPAQFIFKMNMDKIKEKVDEKRAELEATYDVKNLSGEEKEKTTKMIEDFLAAYKKQLLEQAQAQKELEEQAKKHAQNAGNSENSSTSTSLNVMKAFEALDAKSEQIKLNKI